MMRYILIFQVLLLLFIAADCKKNPVSPGPPPPDTTSHNFTFTRYDFGGNEGSSGFKDAAIVSDSDVWIVGAINPATDSTSNAVHWDGRNWNLMQIQFYTICGQSHTTAYPINAVFAFDANDIWFSDGGEMLHWIDNSFSHDCSIGSLINGAINKIWGTSSSNLYAVGNAGTIIHYSNGAWTKMESGTTIDLQDVWGSSDGSVVWACGYKNYNVTSAQSILLKYNGTSWATVWTRQGNATPPYGDILTSLWANDSLFLVGTDGLFRQGIGETDSVEHLFSLTSFPYSIKGSAGNNIAFVGDDAMIYHYNGSTWKLINISTLDQPLYSVAVSKDMIVAVGSDYTIGLGAALIYLGKRS